MKSKKSYFLILFLSIIFLQYSHAQKYSAVDKVVLKYPKSFDTTEELAQRIEKDFNSDYDKARAIYSWMAFNMKYDFNAFLNPPRTQSFSYRNEAEKQRKIQELNDNMLQKAFKSQKAVCEGFTLLYQHLASLVGIKSEIIRGDSKVRLADIGQKNTTSNHAWNTILIDGKWRLVDVTWGQGYYDSSKGRMVKDFEPSYFDTEPDYFFAKHFPDSGSYLGHKLSKEDFLNGPLIYNKAIAGDNKVIAPESGIIEVSKGDKVTFQIKNISKSSQFYYLNRRNQAVRVVNAREKRGSLEFQITFDSSIGDFITFFLDTNSIASFKVVSK
ncbi:Transglutaminase-like superfamily protein [Flavobacterium aquidurense]|uniref:Transglutaminase n=1 Tax=Flavobacterium frigidimaris TaxID=262320 RepID=A0ABX4BLG3_FLAFR|nr:transglutaminase domain-containing protein [Flavobacterium frigidimaris]OXA76121.1 transglutaminase [Flavobacterium frigidimaris]SDY33953.1 Transglutaminase-like superfamily protein [Flavobacterium aquidurense]